MKYVSYQEKLTKLKCWSCKAKGCIGVSRLKGYCSIECQAKLGIHFVAEDNIIVGNVCLFGAVKGEAYINGKAGERFCVRNSGAKAVVEGIGDHGCEYMTGGIAVVLGDFGRNFAAGMSGGVAYLYDEKGVFDEKKFNLEMVELEALQNNDRDTVQELLQNHFDYTQSPKAQSILKNWSELSKNFIKVMPTDYKRALEILAQQELEKSI